MYSVLLSKRSVGLGAACVTLLAGIGIAYAFPILFYSPWQQATAYGSTDASSFQLCEEAILLAANDAAGQVMAQEGNCQSQDGHFSYYDGNPLGFPQNGYYYEFTSNSNMTLHTVNNDPLSTSNFNSFNSSTTGVYMWGQPESILSMCTCGILNDQKQCVSWAHALVNCVSN